MSILAPLLSTDPSSPRLTVYDENAGSRMEFSAQTLDNWANKIANMLDEEFELEPSSPVIIDLPVSWQAAAIALGAFTSSHVPLIDAQPGATPEDAAVFTTLSGAEAFSDHPNLAVVSDDPFGRGVVESGGTLPTGAVDFGPTTRFYADAYLGDSPDLSRWHNPELGTDRVLITGWITTEELEQRVLAPLAGDGSVVVVAGAPSAERLEEIADTEKVTRPLA